jgi:epoxyqueuosine reductase QueG
MGGEGICSLYAKETGSKLSALENVFDLKLIDKAGNSFTCHACRACFKTCPLTRRTKEFL